MRLDRDAIARMIPHAGRMGLLDEVLAWDADSIRASSSTHRDKDNPLARDGVLSVMAGVEYAAQAMAAHGGLTRNTEKPRGGFIASLRDVAWSVDRLDDIAGPLLIEAEKLAGDGAGVTYRFRIEGGARALIAGRATVILSRETV